MLALLTIQRAEDFRWAVADCLGQYHFEYRSGVVRDLPAYQRHVRESSESSPFLEQVSRH